MLARTCLNRVAVASGRTFSARVETRSLSHDVTALLGQQPANRDRLVSPGLVHSLALDVAGRQTPVSEALG